MKKKSVPYILCFFLTAFNFGFFTVSGQVISHPERCLILAEQSVPQIAIVDTQTGEMVWNWVPAEQIQNPEHVKWFNNPSDAKVVYNGEYVLMTASGGACALIRIRDKKTMFYAKAGHNPHSAEILPDGNIVCAASTGNCLTVFKTDTLTFPENVIQRTFHSPFS
ncbi:MAG: hypothetical protein EOM73_14520, partial [Bacteroidia bacterium]|nr:hypothetical protein [Bacteroidia bacterium]